MQKTKLLIVYILLAIINTKPSYSNTALDSVIGNTLPNWKEGYLDIHAINTGRGESTFFIFPDGTTMLLDAAGSTIPVTAPIPPPAQKPNENVTPGLVVSNYTSYFTKPTKNGIDYLVLSHFDPDHMGSYETYLPIHKSGKFKKVGVTEVGSNIPFHKLIDRGYPNYDFPNDMSKDDRIANYINFLNWSQKEYGTKVEKFIVGSNDQIALLKNPKKYENFEIRNICGNGDVWTGVGTSIKNTFPDKETLVRDKASENIFSLGFVMTYGKFNYFTAGDLQYNGKDEYAWKDIERQVAAIVPEVDVMKANHHGTSSCNGLDLLQKLIPRVITIQPWRDVHPNPQTIERMYAVNAECQIFSTNMTENNKTRLGSNLSKFKSIEGHIVIRVNPGGNTYNIYVLDDTNEAYKVKNVYGPYESK